MSLNKAEGLSSAALAYLGDAVVELMVRTRLVNSGVCAVGELNKLALGYVKAGAQSEAFSRIENMLEEDELDVYKRARNSSKSSAPKSSSTLEYRRATGLEALFAYLYLNGRDERMKQLFDAAYPQ